MYKRIVYTFFMAIFIIGCSKPEPAEEEKPPPPPASAEQLAKGVYKSLQLNSKIPSAKEVVTPAVAAKMKTELRRVQTSLSKEVNGVDALVLISYAVDKRIASCADSESWTHVLALIELHVLLKPGSTKHIVTKDRAVVELKKPVVTIKGFLTDNTTQRKKALLDFFMPLEDETYSKTMREGEQLYGLKFEQVIGNDQGIIFFYIEADERFEVFMTSTSS